MQWLGYQQDRFHCIVWCVVSLVSFLLYTSITHCKEKECLLLPPLLSGSQFALQLVNVRSYVTTVLW